MAECELSVLSSQCLGRRMDTLEEIQREATAWMHDCNAGNHGINWQYTTADAQIRLSRLYPNP